MQEALIEALERAVGAHCHGGTELAEVPEALVVPEVLEAPTQEEDLVGAVCPLRYLLPAKRTLTVSRTCQKELPLYITKVPVDDQRFCNRALGGPSRRLDTQRLQMKDNENCNVTQRAQGSGRQE